MLVSEAHSYLRIYAEPDMFHAVQEALKADGITEFTVAELTMLPQNEVEIPRFTSSLEFV